MIHRSLPVIIIIFISRALRATQLVMERASTVVAHPPSASLAMVAAGEEHHILGSSTFTLQNNTGRGVRFWLGHEQHEDRGPAWEGQTTPTTTPNFYNKHPPSSSGS